MFPNRKHILFCSMPLESPPRNGLPSNNIASTGVCAYRRRLLLVGVGLVVSPSGMRLKSALFLCLEVSCPDFNSLKILYRFLFHFSDNDNLVR